MAIEITKLYPGCPPNAPNRSCHAATRGSGRVGRSAGGRALEPTAMEFAVAASVRHEDTPYDELLMSGLDRAEARDRVRGQVHDILDRWRTPER